MKKIFALLMVSILIVSVSFGIYKITNKYSLNMLNKNLEWIIKSKGIEGARSFDFDEKGNLYIAFYNSIKIVKENNKEEILIKQKDLNIYDIIFYKDKLIIASGNDILQYDIFSGETTKLVADLPNRGINKETKLAVKEDKLFITIGTNTNAGIVDRNNNEKDIASFQWTLTGKNYGESKTGAFSAYGNSTVLGQKINEEKISNGAVIILDLITNNISNYSTGIRNIEGLDFDSEGKLMAIVGGMEDLGDRPIKDDKDYIYELKNNIWYGWPDYSGGDPVTSPRFSDGTNKGELLIENPPTKAPYAPDYQHTDVGSLKGLAIDINGECLQKNTIVFGDNKEHCILSLTSDGIVSKIVQLDDNSKVEKIVYKSGSFYVLDSKKGGLYQLKHDGVNKIFILPKIIWIFIISFIVLIFATILFKSKIRK